MSIFSQYKAIKLIPHIHSLLHTIKHQGDVIMNAIERIVVAIEGLRGDLVRKDERLAAAHNEIVALRGELADTQAKLDSFAEQLQALDALDSPATGGSMAGVTE